MTDLLILGASGDLTCRYLLPALAELADAGRLPAWRVVGMALEDWDTAIFRRYAAERLGRRREVQPAAVDGVVERLEYHRGDATSSDDLRAAVGAGQAVVAYLALPPRVFEPAVEALARLPVGPGSRVVIEKPFGEDLASARELNTRLHEIFPEEAVFRVDHFLAKQTVQNVLGLRFANRLFEPLWNNHHVERVDILWDETIALENRAGYYDHAGALRDMVQNHLLQLLALVAMEPPATLNERDLRDRKVDVLRAVTRLTPEEAANRTVRARYTAGRAGGRTVPDYVAEAGVDTARGTETFAVVELQVENWRWAGVPFVLRTGKALAVDRRELRVRFRPVPHRAFPHDDQPEPNTLVLRMDPDRVSIHIALNGAGDPFRLDPAVLTADLAPQELSAYARLLLDVLQGDPTFMIRDDEAEESWRITEPILAAWGAGHPPLGAYTAGSAGPPTQWRDAGSPGYRLG